MVSPVDLPEIRLYMAEFLPREDLVSCVRVCRRWHSSFLPFLWHTINLEPGWQESPTSPPGLVLAKNAHFIRWLTVRTTDGMADYLGNCTNLRMLLIYGQQSDKERLWADVTSLIQRNHSLEWLILGLNLETSPTAEFLRAIPAACPNLKRYESSQSRYEDPAQVEALLQVFARVKTASSRNEMYIPLLGSPRSGSGSGLDSGSGSSSSSSSSSPHLALTSSCPLESSSLSLFKRWTFPNLWELTLKNASGLDTQSQVDLVCQCPNLIHLKWWVRPENSFPVQEFCQRVPICCPRLSQLQMDGCGLPDPNDIGRIVASLRVLDLLTLCGSIITFNTFNSLRRHFGTLQTLDLIDCFDVKSWMIQELLERCPTLQKFRTPPLLMKHIASGQGWKAVGLTIFQATLVASSPSSVVEQQAVWKEISKLTQLQVLLVGGHSPRSKSQGLEIKLEAGMEQSKTLSRLKQFSVGRACIKMEIKDAEWMRENLENWKTFEGCCPGSWLEESPVANCLRESGIEVRCGEDTPWIDPADVVAPLPGVETRRLLGLNLNEDEDDEEYDEDDDYYDEDEDMDMEEQVQVQVQEGPESQEGQEEENTIMEGQDPPPNHE
ncbi:hypothetical protein BGZ83_005550 [Gryganskiella cystojenkinii]|nr:hypothetical protein BGZ83_005550 [Gryganskiella cystojenkinii]